MVSRKEDNQAANTTRTTDVSYTNVFRAVAAFIQICSSDQEEAKKQLFLDFPAHWHTKVTQASTLLVSDY